MGELFWKAAAEEHASPATPSCLYQNIFLSAVAAFAGAAVMVIELAGGRILSPWFGNSLFTWTGLIGTVLVSMSCGYCLGGIIADKHPDYIVLSHLIAIAGAFTMFIPFLHPFLESQIGMMHFISGPVAASLLLFAAPGCLLAAVSPFAVKLRSLHSRDQKVGVSSGHISMFSAFGSVIGTFGAGFWLIPNLRLRTLFLIVGGILVLFAAAGYGLFTASRRRQAPIFVGLCLLFGGAMAVLLFTEAPVKANTLFEQNSYYHQIRVSENRTDAGVTRRMLHLDSTTEGGQYLNARGLPINYQKYWELTKVFCPGIKSALFLGGGGFGMPEALHDAFPQSRIEVVELDPAVIEVGRRFFRIEQHPRMRVFAGDARRHLRHTKHRYDFVFGDAFHGVHNIPAHLVTVEFFDALKRRMTDRGIYMMNVISAVRGDSSLLFHAVANTMAQVFNHIEVFTLDPDHPEKLQILLLLASQEAIRIDELSTTQSINPTAKRIFLKSYLRPDQYAISRQTVLTDEYNPVEYITASARRRKAAPDGN